MSRLVRRKKEIGAAMIVALQLLTVTLVGLMLPYSGGPQQPVKAPADSQMSAAPQAAPVQARPVSDLSARRASAVRATKLYEPRASQIFNLATSRAEASESGRQGAQHSMQEGETPNEATLITDREDYAPYSYVYISGTGFEPGETVNMIVVQLDPNPISYEPWDVVADENGNIDTTWYIFTEELIGATMQVTATGQTSLLTASATFTDNAAPVLYENSGRTIRRDAFAWGDTVYLKGNLNGQSPNRCYKVDWVNPSGSVVQSSNLEPGTLDTSSFVVPSGPSGVWQVRLYEASANSACATATFPGFPGSPDVTLKFDVARAVIIGAVATGGVGGDNWVSEQNPGSVQTGDLQIESKSGQNKRIFVRFNLTGTGISGTVDSALLRMQLVSAGSNFPRTHTANRVTTPAWLESTITWTNQPAFNSATDSQSAPRTPLPALIRWSVTTDVQGFVNSSLVNNGWCIKDATENAAGANNGSYKATDANTATDKTQGPVLLVDYSAASPTPTSTPTSTPTATSTPTSTPTATATFTPTPTPTPTAAATNLVVTAASGTYGGTTTLTATLSKTSDSSPVSGKTITFTLNGNPAGTGVTNASGVATSSTVTLCGSSYNVSGSPYVAGAAASFAGDLSFVGSSGTNSLTVAKANAIVVVTPYDVPYNGSSHTATVTSITGVCGETGATVGSVDVSGTMHVSAAGSPYTDTWSFTGTSNYNNIAAGPSTTITDKINKINATWTTNPASKTYGDADPVPLTTGSGSGFVPADALLLTATYTRAAGENASPPTYHITATLGPADVIANYNITNNGAEFTIDQAPLDITAGNQTKTYGNAFTFAGTEFTTGAGQLKFSDSVTSATLSSTGAAATATVTAPGPNYSITIGSAAFAPAGAGGNYIITYHTGTLHIDPAALDITATDQSKNYGDTFTFTGTEFSTGSGQLKNADSVGSVTLTSAGAAATAGVAGSPYAIMASAATGTGLGNYNISYHNGHLTVHAIALDITATDQSKNYGDTFTFTGAEFSTGAGQLKNSDSVASVTLSSAGAAATAGVAGSPYAIMASAATGTGLGNYNISYHDSHLTVHAIALDITANNQSKNYGDTFTFTGSEFAVGAGQLKNSDSVASVTLTSAGAAATAGVAGSPYAIMASAATGTGLGNYNISYHDGHLTVHAIALDITANDQSKNYGDTFTFTGSEFSTGAGQLKNSDSVASVTLSSAGAAATAGVAGSPYAIMASAATGTGLGNYNISYHDGHLTVHAIALDITATDESKDYGDAFTPNGATQFSTAPSQLKNGDIVANVTLSSSGYAASAPVAGSPYTIMASAAVFTPMGASANYAITYHTGHLTVHAIALDITANDQSKDYGDAFTFTGTEFSTGSGQLKNSDSVASVTLTSAGAAATAGVAGSPYAIMASAATGTGLGNYNISYHDGHLTVHAIALDITANDQSKNYGDTFTFTGSEFSTGAGQLKNSDSVASVTLSSAGAAATAGVAGSPYAIMASAATGTGLGNYNISYHDGHLAVHAIALDITANDQSKNYGDTFTFTGTEFSIGTGQLKNSDSVASVTLSSAGAVATAGVAGSPYAIMASAATGTGLGNYNISYHDGQLTVHAIALDITPNNQSKNYGDTFTFTGSEFAVGAGQLKNSDSVASVTLTSAGAAATAGVAGSPYAIMASAATGTGLGNYNISYHDASVGLTVNAIALDITANNQSKNYGTTFTFTGSEFMVGAGQLKNTDSVDSVTLTSAGAAPTATVAGSPYMITPSAALGTGLSNYNISYHDASVGLTVNAIVLDITANNQSKNYGTTFTFTGSEFTIGAGQLKNTDSVASVTLTSTGAAGTATVAGSPYAIVATNAVGSGLGNYNISYHDGHLTVNAIALDITANNQSKNYGTTFTFTGSEFTVGAGQLKNTDSVASVTLTSTGAPGTATVAGSPYAIVASKPVGSGLSNYNINFHDGHLTVNAIALDITANNQSKNYGTTFTFTGTEFTTGAGQLKNGDAVASLSLGSAGAPVTAMVAGSPYSITASSAIFSPAGAVTNYNITYHGGLFTVNTATLTITATNRPKTYGVTYTPDNTPMSVDFMVSGLVNSDSVTSITLSSGGYGAGATFTAPGPDYTVTPSGAVGTGLGNYTIGYVAGNLHVNQATLTITATNRSKAFAATYTPDTTPPSVDLTIGGLVNSDTVTNVTLTCPGYAAAALPQATPYVVTPSAAVGTGLGNYNVGYVNGQFTIGYATCTGSNGPGGIILQPIDADGSSIFPKAGRTVPVKFTLCDANGNPISDPNAVFAGTGGALTMLSAVRGQIPNPDEAAVNDIPDVAFRYSSGIWIFNMASSNLQSGYTYRFRINLANGQAITFQIAIK